MIKVFASMPIIGKTIEDHLIFITMSQYLALIGNLMILLLIIMKDVAIISRVQNAMGGKNMSSTL